MSRNYRAITWVTCILRHPIIKEDNFDKRLFIYRGKYILTVHSNIIFLVYSFI